MVKLQSAKVMKEVAKENYESFKKATLEGSEFKSLVAKIEEAALEGKTRCSFTAKDRRVEKIYEDALNQAGYRVTVISNLLIKSLEISWIEGSEELD